MENQIMVLDKIRHMFENVCNETWEVTRIDTEGFIDEVSDLITFKCNVNKLRITEIIHTDQNGGPCGTQTKAPLEFLKKHKPHWFTLDNHLYVHSLISVNGDPRELVMVFDYSNSSKPIFEYNVEGIALTSHGRGGGGN
jgi:hypothetical protein